MRVATLLVIDRQPVAGQWGEQTLNVPGALLPTLIPGAIGLGVFVEIEVDPQDTVAQQLDVWAYVRPLDSTLQVVDELIELLHLVTSPVAPVGTVAEPVNQSFVAWIPSYTVDNPRQLWFEARLNNIPEAERWVSLVPRL
ncbi:MAG TPA: hypothetical protein VES65_06220 [Solirubrobacteraceae bacterium]|nr:hypothetical protein [Solirubrobacteraceae bacterium]